MGSFINWYCKQIGKKKVVKADFEGQAYKIVMQFHKNNISLQFQMEECHLLLTDQVDLMNLDGNRVVHDVSKPLPLGGPPGNKERRHALSISKLKAAYYPDFGLEELVLSLWTESESAYDISLAYGKLNHLSGSDKVPLSTAVNLWTRNIVIRQRVEDLQLGIKSYQTKLNLTQPRWDATDFLFKEDYTIVHKPRVVIYRDKNDQKKMMRETEVHKFSDGTSTRILEKIEYMVKEYEIFKFNPGIESRISTEDDKRRNQEFIKLIERRLKIRRIFKSLKSFVSGSQNQRDLPRNNPLVSVEVLRCDIKRSKSENNGIVPTEMELVPEQTQQGTSHEVSIVVMDPVTQCTTLRSHSRSINRLLFHFSRRFTHFYRFSYSELVDIEKAAISSSLRSLKPKCTIESRAKRSSINLIRTLFQYTCRSHAVKTKNILRVLRIILVVLPKHPSDN
ncbi:hypothetical protein Tco_0493392 [Tanacetum coccineum]